MFDQIEAYSGNLVNEDMLHSGMNGEVSSPKAPETPEAILDAARQEAASILEAAKEEAEQLKQTQLIEAVSLAEKEISKQVCQAASDMKLHLFSAKAAMATLVSEALEKIIGEPGHNAASLMAVETAVSNYCADRQVTVHVNRKSADRLRLIAMGSNRSLTDRNIIIHIDPSLSDDRCVLDTGQGKYEVGLAAQIDAFKKLFAEENTRALANAEREIAQLGALK